MELLFCWQLRSNGKIFKILELKIFRECPWVQLEHSTRTGAEECHCQWITWVHRFPVPCPTWVIHQVHLTLLVGVFSHKIHLCPQDTWCQEFLGIYFSTSWFLCKRNMTNSACTGYLLCTSESQEDCGSVNFVAVFLFLGERWALVWCLPLFG